MGQLFYLPGGRRRGGRPAPPAEGALPTAGLMKVQGHVVQMANIHQSNNMSDDEGRAESSPGQGKDEDSSHHQSRR